VIQWVRTRLAAEEDGFTLIELLLVMVILGILMSIAVPSYLSLEDRAQKTAASTNVQSIVSDIEQYSSDNVASAPTSLDPDWNGTDAAGAGTNADSGYSDTWSGTGHDFISLLKSKYDASIVTASYHWNPTGFTGSATDYCVYSVTGRWYAAKHGPAGAITTGLTMTNSTCTAS
jgi:prepilin-type N-terminal cleavage/methylation domain-containing protein